MNYMLIFVMEVLLNVLPLQIKNRKTEKSEVINVMKTIVIHIENACSYHAVYRVIR